MEYTIDITRLVRKLRKRLWLIILVTVIAFVGGVLFTLQSKPDIYHSKVSLYSIAYGSYKDSIDGLNAMMDYSEIVSSKKVADQAANLLAGYGLDAEAIQSMVGSTYTEASAILYIYANSPDPILAKEVANAVAETFVREVRNVTGEESVQILDKADTAMLYYNSESEQLKTRLLFAVVGALLSCGVIVLIEIFSTKLSGVNDCTLNGEIELLGVIPTHSI